MATVTKPIALDESLNTTELSSRNVADVLAQELSAVATAIGGITHPDAEDIVYDNTSSGLTATNVQDAIDEVEGNIPTALSELSDDSTHRLVTDSEKAEWNATTPTDTTDDEPYVIRQGKGNQVDFSLEGASVAWNQLVRNGNFESTANWNKGGTDSFTVSNNVATYKAGAQYRSLNQILSGDEFAGHKIFVCATVKSYTNSNTVMLFRKMTSISPAQYTTETVTLSTSEVRYEKIYEVNSDIVRTILYFQDNNTSGWNNIKIKDVNVFDLTQLFGTTIADAIYSMEQATSGSGVAFFRKYFPKSYYAYDTGSIQSVCVSERKVYDSDNNLVANYPIPTTQLRGLFSLVNGKLKANGDVLKSDGSGTRKKQIITFDGSSDEDWSTRISGNIRLFEIAISGMNAPQQSTPHSITNLYPYELNLSTNKTFRCMNQALSIHYDDVSTVEAFKTLLSSQNLVVVYPLATPTSITTSPFQNPQRAYPDGTEEFVDGLTRDVIVPVGNNSTYTTSDVLASADDYTDGMGKMLLPISAIGTDESGRTTASRAYTTGEFFYMDGKMYKVLTSIASGATFTVGTNISETTLFAELTALA